MEAQRYRISTITATACVNSHLDIDKLFWNCTISGRESDPGIVRAEYVDNKKEAVTRGHDIISRRRTHKTPAPANASQGTESSRGGRRRRFDNQATFLICVDGGAKPAYVINTKVFKNGNVQMTGIKAYEDGITCVNTVICAVRDINRTGVQVAATPDAMACRDYRICMINSDFRLPFRINNQALQNVLIKSTQSVSIYEPCIYPGVKVLYYWNLGNASNDGVCKCRAACCGKHGACKKITIAVFQSGSVIITGATTIEMLDAAYEHISHWLLRHRSAIEQKSMAEMIDEMARCMAITDRANNVNDIMQYFARP